MSAAKILEKMYAKHGYKVNQQEIRPKNGAKESRPKAHKPMPKFRLPEGSSLEAHYHDGHWHVTLRSGDGKVYTTTKNAIYTAITCVGKCWYRAAKKLLAEAKETQNEELA